MNTESSNIGAENSRKRVLEPSVQHPNEDRHGVKGVCINPLVKSTHPIDGNRAPETPLSEKTIQLVPVHMDTASVAKRAQISSSFYSECQALIHRFMHKALPEQTLQPGQIARGVHGAMHLSRAAMWVPILLSLRQQMGDPAALNFPASHLPFVMKAALLHDSGREGEGEDTLAWEQASGEQCEDHLLSIDCPPEIAADCKQGIMNKDGHYRKEKTLIEKLIHDADCLEIMRVPEGNSFDMKYLDMFQDFKDKPDINNTLYEVASQVRAVIASQGDLWGPTNITNTDVGNRFTEAWDKMVTSTLSTEKKKPFEFADNAFSHQLNALKVTAPELYSRYVQCAGEPLTCQNINPLALTKTRGALGYSKGSSFTGEYTDSATNKQYYIKEPENPESARNEVLMAKLAKELGLEVPDIELVRTNGRTFIVSEWQNGLTQGEDVLKQANPQQLARLYLVAAVLGNADIVGYSFDNTRINKQGEPVALDWGEAGEFGAPNASKHKTDSFGSTVYELDTLLNPVHPKVGDHQDTKAVVHNAAAIFKQLTKEDIHSAAQELLQRDTRQLQRLIETLGPDTPMDRQHLQTTISHRLAYLARRFPESCSQRVTSAEQAAIHASGVYGYSLPVSDKDIDRADLRLYQYQDKANQPITECWVKLKPEAARRLSERLGLPPRYHRDIEQLNTYIKALKKPTPMTTEWRARLETMQQLCRAAKSGIQDNLSRFNPSDADTAEKIKHQISNMENKLGLMIAKPDGVNIDLAQQQELTSQLPEGFPTRVTTGIDELIKTSFQPQRTMRYGRAWETDEQQTIENAHHYRLRPECLLSDQFISPTDNLQMDWYSDTLSENFAMESIIKLRIQGQSESSSRQLVEALDVLGIDTHRPDLDAVQEQYMDALAHCYCLDQQMNCELPADIQQTSKERSLWKSQWLSAHYQWKEAPRWEDHHQIHSGRCIFYRPMDQFLRTEFQLVHELIPYPYGLSYEKEREDILPKIFHSGGSLCPLVDRVRMGAKQKGYTSRNKDFQTGGGTQIFSRLRLSKDLPEYFLLLTPDVLFRTDLTVYDDDKFGNRKEAFTQLNRKRPCKESWDDISTSYRNELMVPSLSLDEVISVTAPTSAKRKLIETQITRQIEHWPNGQPLSAVMNLTIPVTYQTMREGVMGALVKAVEYQQFDQFIKINPELDKGKLTSLNGLAVHSQYTFSKKDMSCIDLKNTILKSTKLDGCRIEPQQLNMMELIYCSFTDCVIEGSSIDFKRIKTCAFVFTHQDQVYQDTFSQLVLACQADASKNKGTYDDKAIPETLKNCESIGLLSYQYNNADLDHLLCRAPRYISQSEFSDDVIDRIFDHAQRVKRSNPHATKILELIRDPGSKKSFLKNNPNYLLCLVSEKDNPVILKGVTAFMNLRKPTHLPVQPHSKGFEENDVAPSIGLGS